MHRDGINGEIISIKCIHGIVWLEDLYTGGFKFVVGLD